MTQVKKEGKLDSQFGGKVRYSGETRSLALTVRRERNIFRAIPFVKQVPGREKTPGLTTALFLSARYDLMRLADASSTDIIFEYETTKPRMKEYFVIGVIKQMFSLTLRSDNGFRMIATGVIRHAKRKD